MSSPNFWHTSPQQGQRRSASASVCSVRTRGKLSGSFLRPLLRLPCLPLPRAASSDRGDSALGDAAVSVVAFVGAISGNSHGCCGSKRSAFGPYNLRRSRSSRCCTPSRSRWDWQSESMSSRIMAWQTDKSSGSGVILLSGVGDGLQVEVERSVFIQEETRDTQKGIA